MELLTSQVAGCWGNTVDLTTAGFAEAAVNFVDARNPPLTSDTVKPANTTNPGNAEFGEAGLDLTQAGVFGEGSCETFGRAYAVSRSSGTSSQAAMEDIVGPGAFLLTNCASVNVTKTGSDGGSQSGAVFTLYSGTTTSGTVVGTCTVDSTGQCGTSPSFVDLQPGSYTIDETSVPTGYDKDASLPFTFSVVAGEAKSLAFTNVAAPGHIDIAKTDDADAPLDGATFTLYDGSSTTATVLGTCTTGVSNYNSSTTPTAGSGTCSFIDVPPGTYTVDETGVPTGYAKASGLPETFTLGNGGTKTISASNPRTFKVIELVCRQADATLYPSSATIGGQSSGTTLSRSDLDSVLSGLTSADRDAVQAALCGLSTSQGARGGFQTGTTTATVGIS